MITQDTKKQLREVTELASRGLSGLELLEALTVIMTGEIERFALCKDAKGVSLFKGDTVAIESVKGWSTRVKVPTLAIVEGMTLAGNVKFSNSSARRRPNVCIKVG